MITKKASNGTFWTDKEMNYLSKNYYSCSIQEIALILNRSVSSVRVKAQRMGLKKAENKIWTLEEQQYLEDHWGDINYQTLAKRLKRSPEAIRMRAHRLGYPSYQLSQDGITLIELAKALRVDYKKVRRWVDGPSGHSLPSFRIKISDKQRKRLVNLDKFWRWAKKNRGLIDFNLLEKNSLGAEPPWVDEQRKQDYYDKQKRLKHSTWTTKEEQLLDQLVNEFKYSYREIATRLGRSEKVIAHKLLDLNIMARPLKAERKIWTEKETDMLLSLVEAGIDYSTIADKLERSETAIRGKIRKIKASGFGL